MTEATQKPVARVLTTRYSKYVVELTTDTITIREKGSRRGGPSEVSIGVGPLHQRLVIEKNKRKR